MPKERFNPLPDDGEVVADGFHCGLEGDATLYRARKIFPGVFQIGRYRYSGTLKPLTKGAPRVDMCWDWETETKMQNTAWRARCRAIHDGKFFEAMLGKPAPTDDRKLRALDRTAYLRIECRKCGRTRLDGIGFLVGECRFGDRTISEFQAVIRCGRGDCNGEQAVTVEGE